MLILYELCPLIQMSSSFYFLLILECGGLLIGTYGSIKSPGYPGNYPPGRDCVWNIITPPGMLITFTFGTLSLEHQDDCSKDYLEVSDCMEREFTSMGHH